MLRYVGRRGAAQGRRVHARCPLPIPVPSPGLYQEVHLEELTAAELTGKLAELLGLPAGQILRVSRQGPSGIHILISDAVRTRGGHTRVVLDPAATLALWGPQPAPSQGSAPTDAPCCSGMGVRAPGWDTQPQPGPPHLTPLPHR